MKLRWWATLSGVAIAAALSGRARAQDAYEPDDTYGAARALLVGEAAQTHDFHANGDQDWCVARLLAGSSYSIRTENEQSNADTVLELYDVDGTTVLVSRDDNGPGFGETITRTITATGFYFVRVRNANPAVYGANTQYTLRLDVNAAYSLGLVYGFGPSFLAMTLPSSGLSGLLGYNLERATAVDGTYTQVNEVGDLITPAEAEHYVDTSLALSTPYCYRAIGVNATETKELDTFGGWTTNGPTRMTVPTGDSAPIAFLLTDVTMDFASNSVEFKASVNPIGTAPPNLSPAIARHWDISALGGSVFSVAIAFSYTHEQVAAASLGESSLKLMKSGNGGASWTEVPSVLDMDANTITTSNPQTSFSLWAISGSSPSSVCNWQEY